MTTNQLENDPLWYKDAIIYELAIKSFYDSNGDGVGDLPGLIQKLDYLQDLGVNCLWLLPFYPSPLKDDGYDISDYHGVNPKYGTLRDFKRFVHEAHARGMRVITELVINHTSDQHPWFQAARQAPPGSIKRNYYVWSHSDRLYADARIIFLDTEKSNWTWDPVAQAYYWHRFFSHQPDLNFDNPHVRRAVMRTMRYWLDMGVDGLRLDAIPYLIERDGTNCENLPETHAVLKELRAQLEAEYPDRMFLAEANQWPDDVRPYFGDGDECHMAFHFPVMPRMFMALRQEDRHPITEIMRRTPEIPENCQWAIFLRNHDELTLEMVTSEERDYMYREYAADPKARINLGIRRRLAPLVDYSRRRIELLNSLLLSFPGTPVLYYGDEIGMGDNIYLGDRNGVRTPMQWSADRNGGFSRADFAALYNAPIMDPVSGYQTVNVEAQERDPSSLLNWMKRMIAIRKQYKIFGRGSMEFVRNNNRKVLAYIRRYEDQVVLAVANLSRFVQPVELNLAEFEGFLPLEMFGRTQFPACGTAPYFITLGPHAFYWFELQPAHKPIATVGTEPTQLPNRRATVVVRGDWGTLLEDRARGKLEKEVLPAYFRRQRWFPAKARVLRGVKLVDWTLPGALPGGGHLLLAETSFDDGARQLYFVPIGVRNWDEAIGVPEPFVLARLNGPDGEALLCDALIDDAFCRGLLDLIASGGRLPMRRGVLRGEPTPLFDELRGPRDDVLPIQRGAIEQSNSSIVYDQRLLMKVFRRLEPGINPDYEICRYLAETAGFQPIPKTAGGLFYERGSGEPMTVGLLQQLVRNQGTGWQQALRQLTIYYESVLTETAAPELPDASGLGLLDLLRDDPPELIERHLGAQLQGARRLGERTAEMHLALAAGQDPAFHPEPMRPEDLEQLSDRARQQAEQALATLQTSLEGLRDSDRARAERVLAGASELIARVRALPELNITATKIRVHGDYHLGQVLWSENDFVILDFEGEPARPLAERRAKTTPLRDVVGMLRSFEYAAFAALFAFGKDRPVDFEKMAPWARGWERWISAAFLRGYFGIASGASFLPAGDTQLLALVEVLLVEKSHYELLYELNNRPDWVSIPLQSIITLVEAEFAGHSAVPAP